MTSSQTAVEADHAPPPPPLSRRWFDGFGKQGYVFVAPLLLWIGLTILVPLAYAFYTSLTDQRVIGTASDVVWFENFQALLGDSRFWLALRRSLVWAVGGALLQVSLAFTTALVLNAKFRGRRIARTWIIVSWIVPTIVVAMLWRWILSGTFGPINHILRSLGFDAIDFLGSANWAMASVVFINAWRWFPFLALVLLAGFSSINQDYLEAARVDGASKRQEFLHITLPLLQPVLFVVGLIGTLWSLKIFDIIWLMTSGGPAGRTTTLPVLIYERAFEGFRIGEGAAISVLFFVFMVLFATVFIRFVPKGDLEDEVL